MKLDKRKKQTVRFGILIFSYNRKPYLTIYGISKIPKTLNVQINCDLMAGYHVPLSWASGDVGNCYFVSFFEMFDRLDKVKKALAHDLRVISDSISVELAIDIERVNLAQLMD